MKALVAVRDLANKRYLKHLFENFFTELKIEDLVVSELEPKRIIEQLLNFRDYLHGFYAELFSILENKENKISLLLVTECHALYVDFKIEFDEKMADFDNICQKFITKNQHYDFLQDANLAVIALNCFIKQFKESAQQVLFPDQQPKHSFSNLNNNNSQANTPIIESVTPHIISEYAEIIKKKKYLSEITQQKEKIENLFSKAPSDVIKQDWEIFKCAKAMRDYYLAIFEAFNNLPQEQYLTEFLNCLVEDISVLNKMGTQYVSLFSGKHYPKEQQLFFENYCLDVELFKASCSKFLEIYIQYLVANVNHYKTRDVKESTLVKFLKEFKEFKINIEEYLNIEASLEKGKAESSVKNESQYNLVDFPDEILCKMSVFMEVPEITTLVMSAKRFAFFKNEILNEKKEIFIKDKTLFLTLAIVLGDVNARRKTLVQLKQQAFDYGAKISGEDYKKAYFSILTADLETFKTVINGHPEYLQDQLFGISDLDCTSYYYDYAIKHINLLHIIVALGRKEFIDYIRNAVNLNVGQASLIACFDKKLPKKMLSDLAEELVETAILLRDFHSLQQLMPKIDKDKKIFVERMLTICMERNDLAMALVVCGIVKNGFSESRVMENLTEDQLTKLITQSYSAYFFLTEHFFPSVQYFLTLFQININLQTLSSKFQLDLETFFKICFHSRIHNPRYAPNFEPIILESLQFLFDNRKGIEFHNVIAALKYLDFSKYQKQFLKIFDQHTTVVSDIEISCIECFNLRQEDLATALNFAQKAQQNGCSVFTDDFEKQLQSIPEKIPFEWNQKCQEIQINDFRLHNVVMTRFFSLYTKIFSLQKNDTETPEQKAEIRCLIQKELSKFVSVVIDRSLEKLIKEFSSNRNYFTTRNQQNLISKKIAMLSKLQEKLGEVIKSFENDKQDERLFKNFGKTFQSENFADYPKELFVAYFILKDIDHMLCVSGIYSYVKKEDIHDDGGYWTDKGYIPYQ